MKVSCDEVQVNASVKNDMKNETSAVNNQPNNDNFQLLDKIKEYINEQLKREFNKKRW